MAALRCQQCDQPLSSAEIQDGWCENCGKRVPAGLLSAAARGEVEPVASRPVSSQRGPVSEVAVARSKSLLGWGTVRAGLALVFVGVLLLVLGWGLLEVFVLEAKASTVKELGTGKKLLLTLSPLLMQIGGILLAAGMCMGCAAPSDPGPRGWAIGISICVALLVLNFLLKNTFELENARVERENYARTRAPANREAPPKQKEVPYGEGTMKALGYALEGTVWLAGILFLLFLRGTGTTLHSSGVATNAVVYLVAFVVVGATSVLIRVAAASRSLSSGALEALSWVKVGAVVLMAAWLLAVVGLARGTVTRALAR